MTVLLSDDFTSAVGDGLLSDYDADWVRYYGTNNYMWVFAGTDDVRFQASPTAYEYVCYGWGASRGYQKITADLYGYDADAEVGLCVALAANAGYAIHAQPGNAFQLRDVSDWSTLGTFDTAGAMPADSLTTITVEFDPATGDITLTVGGGTPQTINDSTYTAGRPGASLRIGLSSNGFNHWTNPMIEDDGGAAATERGSSLQRGIQRGLQRGLAMVQQNGLFRPRERRLVMPVALAF